MIHFCLVFIFLDFATSAYDRHIELFEGSSCDLPGGRNVKGKCVVLPQCRVVLQQVLRNERRATNEGRCGFEGKIEIVCCPLHEIAWPSNLTRTANSGMRLQITPSTPESVSLMTTMRMSTTTDSTGFLNKLDLRPADIACISYETWTTGEMSDKIFPHITNGERAAFGEFPFVVALGYRKEDDPTQLKYICGGTLISSRYVLTAAHCVNNIGNTVPIEVKLGIVNLTDSSNVKLNVKIEHITSHPLYKRTLNYHDIAIIELQQSVNISKNVMPICLQTKPITNLDLLASSDVLVIGWGATSIENEGTNELQKTPSLTLIKNNECRKSYEGLSKLPHGLDDSMICVLDKNVTRSSDACQGDSGGPLLLKGSNTNFVIGITSFGQSCGSRVPAVYTSVHFYLDWIESVVWPNKKLN